MPAIETLFTGRILDCRLNLDNQDLFKQAIIKNNGKYVFLTLEPIYKQRTLPQNAYYHSVIVTMLAEFFGYTHDEMHFALKMKFLPIYGENGAPNTCGSTRKLTTVEFCKLIEDIRTWAICEHDFYIPEPNEVDIRGGQYEHADSR